LKRSSFDIGLSYIIELNTIWGFYCGTRPLRTQKKRLTLDWNVRIKFSAAGYQKQISFFPPSYSTLILCTLHGVLKDAYHIEGLVDA